MKNTTAATTGLTDPVHTAAVGLGNLRFFRSPLDGPRLPWFALSDLFTCLAMDRSLRRTFHHKIKHEWRKDVCTVWTATGETLIAPHFMAQGLVDSIMEMGRAPAGSDLSYAKGAAGAMDAMAVDMTELESLNNSIAAWRNENGITEPFELIGPH